MLLEIDEVVAALLGAFRPLGEARGTSRANW